MRKTLLPKLRPGRTTVSALFLVAFFLLALSACAKTEAREASEDFVKNADGAADVLASGPAAPEELEEPQQLDDVQESLPLDPVEEYINARLANMTLAEKVGQLFVCAFRRDGQDVTELNASMKEALSVYHLGGVVLFEENLRDKQQTKQLIADLQNESAIPLFIAVDEEGGTVARLPALGYERLPRAAKIGASGDSSQAFEQGLKIAATLKELGFNLDFAPVADLNSNKQNSVIGSRAFSDDAQIAGEMVREFVDALQGAGIIATLKHFPGHGDTKADSHYGLATVSHDLKRLNDKELVPFIMGIEAGAGLVMVGHISLPNVTGDNEAAIFSAQIVTKLLREQLGFSGVIITDAMDMGAVVKLYGADVAAIKAVLAGVDMLLMPEDLALAYDGVLNAALSGEISESRLDESLSRILRLKARFGIVNSN